MNIMIIRPFKVSFIELTSHKTYIKCGCIKLCKSSAFTILNISKKKPVGHIQSSNSQNIQNSFNSKEKKWENKKLKFI